MRIITEVYLPNSESVFAGIDIFWIDIIELRQNIVYPRFMNAYSRG